MYFSENKKGQQWSLKIALIPYIKVVYWLICFIYLFIFYFYLFIYFIFFTMKFINENTYSCEEGKISYSHTD